MRVARLSCREFRKAGGCVVEHGVILNLHVDMHFLCEFEIVGDGPQVLIQALNRDAGLILDRAAEQAGRMRDTAVLHVEDECQ